MMWINAKSIEKFGAKLMEYHPGKCGIVTESISTGTLPILLNSGVGMRTLTFSVTVYGNNRKEVAYFESLLDEALLGRSELLMPDGFYYTCLPVSSTRGNESLPTQIDLTYTMSAVRHEEQKWMYFANGSGRFQVMGNLRTDAVICVTPQSDQERFQLTLRSLDLPQEQFGVGFEGMQAARLYTVDGEKKQVSCEGLNYFLHTDLISFPNLVPGIYQLDCSAPAEVKIAYYPVFL